MSRPVTVAKLAARANMDLDDVLVSLWDAGIDDIYEPDDVVPSRLLKAAEAALEIENPRHQTRIDYWLKRTGMTRAEFVEDVALIGVKIQPNMRTLPKGGLRRVRRRFEPVALVTQDTAPLALDLPPFEWHDVGTRRPIVFLEEEDVLSIHGALVRDFALAEDPISPPGVKSPNLVSSAVHRPQTSYGSDYKYPTVELAAAALLHSIVQNHAFYNGNKRTGLVSMLAFLDRNNVIATCNQQELFRFTLRVAQHGLVPMHYDQIADREVLKIAEWIRSNSRRVERGERPIPWLRLKRILTRFDCEIEHAPGKGNRLDIRRRVETKSRFGRKKTRILPTQVAYGGDGTEVERNTLNKIRNDLELDEPHGVDSQVFYGSQAEPDDFIQTYRTVLRRLARL